MTEEQGEMPSFFSHQYAEYLWAFSYLEMGQTKKRKRKGEKQ